MIRAVWKGTVVAEAPQTVRVEGNHYFPLCCVSPVVLGLLGIISAATTFAWANNLYGNYAWWFRLGGLAVLAALVWLSLRRQRQCRERGSAAAGASESLSHRPPAARRDRRADSRGCAMARPVAT
jgi:hypothetical protein